MEEQIMEEQIKFSDLWLSEKMLKAIEKKGYIYPSPVQAWVIPLLLNWNKDIIGQAQTGTWKTAAFALPILERLDMAANNIQALILTPTRELAIQIAEEIKSFADREVKVQLLYGWQNIREELMWLKRVPHIVVWTPWRVIDHLMKRKTLRVEKIKYFVLDEADEMLNIWFKDEIEEIITQTPKEKKVLLFSATMPRVIKEIVWKYIKDHDLVSIQKDELSSKIEQKCYKVNERDKFEALCRIIEVEFDFYWIVFCKTKADVDDVASRLMSRGYKVEWIHWDIEQKQREKTLTRFKTKTITLLVATDVAARWIDVDNLTHVINYTLPDNPETYTHRIWRTGRAWNKWEAISLVSSRDSRMLMFIERVIKQKIKIEKLPDVAHVIEFKKKRLIDNIKEIISKEEWKYYLELSKQLLELWTAEEVLSAILKESYNTEFDEAHYSAVKEDVRVIAWGQIWWQIRLFVAKGRDDNFSPWTLIQFLEKEVWTKLWDVWRIEVLREFSFINVSAEDGELVLAVFKQKNPIKPLVVQAKEKTGESGWSRGWFWWGSRSSSGWSREWWYRGWSSSRGWFSWGSRSSSGWSREWWYRGWSSSRGWYKGNKSN